MATRPTNNDILTQLQIDMATTKGEVTNLSNKVDSLDQKIDAGFDNMKGYVPAAIYALHQDAQKIINADHETRLKKVEDYIDANGTGIKFSSDIVRNVLKVVAAAAGAAVVLVATYVLLKNGL